MRTYVEFLRELNFQNVRLIVSTIPDFKTNHLIIRKYREENLSGIVILISNNIEEAKKLYLAGATYVVMPHYLGAHQASKMIEKYYFDTDGFEKERNLHLSRLEKREA